jgi:hypothetical protein
MAMVGNDLGDAILTALDVAVAGVVDKTDTAAMRQAVFRSIGNAIVTYISANAVVSTATTSVVPTATALAVFPAVGAATGTGTGTIA